MNWVESASVWFHSLESGSPVAYFGRLLEFPQACAFVKKRHVLLSGLAL